MTYLVSMDPSGNWRSTKSITSFTVVLHGHRQRQLLIGSFVRVLAEIATMIDRIENIISWHNLIDKNSLKQLEEIIDT